MCQLDILFMKQSAKQWMKIFRFGISNEISVKNTEKHFADCTNAIPFFWLLSWLSLGRSGLVGSGAALKSTETFFKPFKKRIKQDGTVFRKVVS